MVGEFNVYSRGVLPKPRVFTSGARDLVEHYG